MADSLATGGLIGLTNSHPALALAAFLGPKIIGGIVSSLGAKGQAQAQAKERELNRRLQTQLLKMQQDFAQGQFDETLAQRQSEFAGQLGFQQQQSRQQSRQFQQSLGQRQQEFGQQFGLQRGESRFGRTQGLLGAPAAFAAQTKGRLG